MPRALDPIPALKRQFGAELARCVAGWNADNIGYVLGTDRFRVAELRRAQLDRFSLETLIRFLRRLGLCVDVHVTARPTISERRRLHQSDG